MPDPVTALNVIERRGASGTEWMWKDTRAATDFARSIFPMDPLAVDYPFYFLGRWLYGRELHQSVLAILAGKPGGSDERR